jgi:hypothetical protein
VVGIAWRETQSIEFDRLLTDLADTEAAVVPIYFEKASGEATGKQRVFIVAGQPFDFCPRSSQIEASLARLRDKLHGHVAGGMNLEHALSH